MSGFQLAPNLMRMFLLKKQQENEQRMGFAQEQEAKRARDLDYAHAGTMLLFDDESNLDLVGTNGDWEDKDFWSERVHHAGNLVALIQDDRAHPERHDHRTYLCKLQALRSIARGQ